MWLSRWREKERFKAVFSSELLEYHFERTIGENENNSLPWKTLLENRIQPHVDILCDLSRWFISQGWSREVVEEAFFVVEEDDFLP